jgi:hypothetical protein
VLFDKSGRELARAEVLTARLEGPDDLGTQLAGTAAGATRGFATSAGRSEGEVAGAPGAKSGTTPEPLDPGASWRRQTARQHDSRGNGPPLTFVMGPFGRIVRKLSRWVPPGASETTSVPVRPRCSSRMVAAI